ncbi:MAG: hypothetical protein ACFFDY_03730 [Candidatus Thorarchaeota archaeon]
MSSVIVKADAYYKMLVHVLRFGNKARDRRQFKEVMGILIGRLEGEPDKKGIREVIIEDAIPISHGGAIEVAFAPEDYITFSMVDAAYAEKNWFSCGWYHSHPGLDIFFSSTDIKNQLGWQTPNPSAIGIVFDHTHLETPGDLGFRTFRLDNPAKGQMSGYHEVKTIIEPPDSIEYYIKLMELISCIHSKEPPILEINEMPDLFGDITFPSESQILAKKPELDTSKFISTINAGLTKFLELSFTPFISMLNSWGENMIRNTVEKNLQIRKDMMAIKNKLSEGILSLQKNFKFSLKEQLNDLDIYIDDKFEEIDTDQENLKNLLESLEIELNQQIKLLLEEKHQKLIEDYLVQFNEYIDKLTEINTKVLTASESFEEQKNILDGLAKNISSLEYKIAEALDKNVEEISGGYTKNANKVIGNFINLNKEAKNFLSDLKAAIILLESSKTPLQNKLDSQVVEIKTLQKSIAELKGNNEKLLSKIESLEKKEETE